MNFFSLQNEFKKKMNTRNFFSKIKKLTLHTVIIMVYKLKMRFYFLIIIFPNFLARCEDLELKVKTLTKDLKVKSYQTNFFSSILVIKNNKLVVKLITKGIIWYIISNNKKLEIFQFLIYSLQATKFFCDCKDYL